MTTRTSFAFVFGLGIAAAASAQAPPYCWDRSMEWVVQPASAVGTTQGNPGPDIFGNPVWHMEYVTTGGGLGSANPWYLEPATKCVWDDSWYGQPGGWVVSDDFGVNISQFGGIDHYGANGVWYQYKPIVRWVNATGQAFSLQIDGTLRISWGSSVGNAGKMPTEVVIVHRQSAGGANLLYSNTVDKPSSSTANEFIDLPISIPSFAVATSDEVIISIRATGTSVPSRFVSFGDNLRMLRDGGVLATETVRLGAPPNPNALSPGQTARPMLSRVWDPAIDHTTFLPSATIDVLFVTAAVANVPTVFGTVLCDLTGGLVVLAGPPGAPFPIRIPNDCRFVGVGLCIQGASGDAISLAAGVTNALDVIVGTH